MPSTAPSTPRSAQSLLRRTLQKNALQSGQNKNKSRKSEKNQKKKTTKSSVCESSNDDSDLTLRKQDLLAQYHRAVQSQGTPRTVLANVGPTAHNTSLPNLMTPSKVFPTTEKRRSVSAKKAEAITIRSTRR